MARFAPFQSSFLTSPTSAISTLIAEAPEPTDQDEPLPITPTVVNNIVLNVEVRYNYDEINDFIKELQSPDKRMVVGDRTLSVFELYTLYLLDDPVDMSNLTERKIHRPKLFVRKNDKFGPFNFSYLLNLFDIEYKMSEDDEFPKLWKTTFDTDVTVNVLKSNQVPVGQTPTELHTGKNEGRTLLDILKIICREQKYDEQHAVEWKKNFEGKITHLTN